MGKRGPMPKDKLGLTASVPTMSKADKDRERRWRAEDDLRTCERYAEIERDKQRMADMKSLAKEKMADLQKVVKK